MRGFIKRIFKNWVVPQVLVIFGGEYGDEGKGKIVSALSQVYDIIVRFSGGANAGHTSYDKQGRKIATRLLPSGLVYPGKTLVLGAGVFINLELLLEELSEVKTTLGFTPNLLIDLRCAITTVYAKLIEAKKENGSGAIGTTRKAIGPTASLDVSRDGLRIEDFLRGRSWVQRVLENQLKANESQLRDCDYPTTAEHAAELCAQFEFIREMVTDTAAYLNAQIEVGKRVLIEASQATGLDQKYGSYCHVTSGTTTILGVSQGSGIFPRHLAHSIMVIKVPGSKVGKGPWTSEIFNNRQFMEDFPKENLYLFQPTNRTEETARTKWLRELQGKINSGEVTNQDIALYFQVLNGERGTVTKRGRSIGWPNIAWTKEMVRQYRPDMVAITHGDSFDGLDSMKVISEIEALNPAVKGLPITSLKDGDFCTKFEIWPCWAGHKIFGRSGEFSDLPMKAQDFFNSFGERIGCRIGMVGTGPGLDELVFNILQ